MCLEDLSRAELRSVFIGGEAFIGLAIVLCSVSAEDFRRFGGDLAAAVGEQYSTEGWLPKLFDVAELASSGTVVATASSLSFPALEDIWVIERIFT
ncbi:hypothetical protein MRX96_024882 [Rhipicephalus microplus]